MTEPRKRLWEVTVTWTAAGYAWAATETEALLAVNTSDLLDDADCDLREAFPVTKKIGHYADGLPVYSADDDDLTVGEAWAMQEQDRLDDEKRAAAEALQEKLKL